MDNSTANSTLNATTEQEPSNLHVFIGTSIFSIVYLIVMMIPTTVVNGLTLFAIYKDPLKCFRNPLAIFVTGVIVADFLTGLFVHPLLAAAYAHDMDLVDDVSFALFHVGIEVLTTTVTTSFLTLLALAISQLMAIRWPFRYERYVTNRSAKIGLVCIWSYAVVFVIVPHFFAVGPYAFFMILMVFHISVITVALVILYIVTYFIFAAKARQLEAVKDKQVNREFFKGTCLLALLQILTVWPFAISLYVEEFHETQDGEEEVRLHVTRLICDDLLLVKFLLDPIILVWRLPKYRQAMKMVYARCLGSGREMENAGRAAYNRSNVDGSAKKNPDDDTLEDVEVEVL